MRVWDRLRGWLATIGYCSCVHGNGWQAVVFFFQGWQGHQVFRKIARQDVPLQVAKMIATDKDNDTNHAKHKREYCVNHSKRELSRTHVGVVVVVKQLISENVKEKMSIYEYDATNRNKREGPIGTP
jgi:hypothetical protein